MKNEGIKGLPTEVQELALRERITKEYPALYTDGLLLVDTQTTRLALDDISYRAPVSVQDSIETLALSCRGWLEVYDARYLTSVLAQKLDSLFRVIDRRRSLIIFPGNGAQVVKDLLLENIIDGLISVDIKTQRRIAKSGAVEGVEIGDKTKARELLSKMRAETIVVLDDVITTGATLTALRETFPARNIEWFGGALLMLSPLQSRRKARVQSGVDGFSSVIAPIIYQGTTGIPPLNSLSTLVGSSGKSKTVRTKYMNDYVEDRGAFLDAAEKLRRFL